MRDFDLVQPKSLTAALDALAQNDPNLRPLAGGTDMLVDIRSGRATPNVLVSLQDIAELRGIRRENGTLTVGAATTISEFLTDPHLTTYDALTEAAYYFANPMIRNLATVGGNLTSASPAGDMLPPLLALGAQVELVSASTTRVVPLDQLFLAPRKTVKRADELVANLRLPAAGAKSLVASSFYKLGLRRADAISIVSVAVWLRREGDTVADVRIALGAVAPRPMRATSAEAVLRGQPFNDANVQEAARLASGECSPIDDLRASAAYRRRMVQVYVRRMLEQTWNKTL